MKRKIIEINEELCNGCGQCITGCAEAALTLVDGKARLVSDVYCDGLGACLGECPTGALTLVEREAPAFDEQAVHERVKSLEKGTLEQKSPTPGGGCPSGRFQMFTPCEQANLPRSSAGSALSHWPVQIRLVPPHAPFLKGADLLVAADCTTVACPGFHSELLQGRVVLMGCPKFDDQEAMLTKFVDILARGEINSITVASMEVPCCSGLPGLVAKAREMAKSKIPVEQVVISVRGEILERSALAA